MCFVLLSEGILSMYSISSVVERVKFSTYVEVVDLALELLKVGVELHLALVQAVVRLLAHLSDDHLELVEHHLHACRKGSRGMREISCWFPQLTRDKSVARERERERERERVKGHQKKKVSHGLHQWLYQTKRNISSCIWKVHPTLLVPHG